MSTTQGQQRENERFSLSTRHIVGLGASAFLAGTAGATIFLLRRRGLHHVDGVVASATSGVAPAPAAAPEEPVKGPWALFREMNAAALKRGTSMRAAPATVRAQPAAAKPRQPSMPTLAQTSPAPAGIGALRKGAPAQPAPTRTSESAPTNDDGSDGPLLAIRALAIATAIVATGAATLVVTVRQALGVSTISEFADAMHKLVPAIGEPASQVASQLPRVPLPETDESVAPPLDAPLPLEVVVDKLLSSSDPVEWLRISRQQLDAELAAEQEARRRATT